MRLLVLPWLLVFALAQVACGVACGDGKRPVRIQGAGASFPAPLYHSWIKKFRSDHPDVRIDYQSVGSGSSVKNIIDGTVDFGASDAPMTPQEMKSVARGVQFLPLTAGSIVIAYDLEGVPELKLTREAYAGIFLGDISMWNHPAIATANPGVALPDERINVVVRADSSGTSYVFTKHLSAISEKFAKSPGVHKMPSWPVGTRSKGNEGVTASIKTTPGSIGYVEYAYAESQKLSTAALQNKTGDYVKASTASGQTALSDVEFPDNLIAWASDPAQPGAYPIVTYTWLMLYERYDDPRKLDALKEFVRYAISEGQEKAEELGYIPLPQETREKVRSVLDNVERAREGQS